MSLAKRFLIVLSILCGWFPNLAFAQSQSEQVKPYIMVLVDSSGSMTMDLCHDNSVPNDFSHICGDNSVECPGKKNTAQCPNNQVRTDDNGDLPCSHCNSFGCGNGIPDDTRLFKVKAGAYNVVSAFGEVVFGLSRFRQTPTTFSCDAEENYGVGGWRGANTWDCSAQNLGTGHNQADVLVALDENNQANLLQWINNCDDYPSVGACPQTLPPSSGCNLCPDCGGGCDKELRGSIATPIAGSLYDLRNTYFPNVIASDAKKQCRPYKVLLLSDGEETCGGNPNQEANRLYAPPTGTPTAGKSIPVHVIGFGTSALKPALDGIASNGGTSAAVIVDNEVSLALAMANIISESILVEVCNGIDDDCDELCDEHWPQVAVTHASCPNKRSAQTCTAGKGICLRTGTFKCKADGSGVECNVTPGLPNPGGEICGNALDDNCDGAIDEGCTPCVPQPEICDGKDNDCDGSIDEGYVSSACGSDIGECTAGTTACISGKVVCQNAKGPVSETCDNKDNDCDTVIDLFSEPCFSGSLGGCVLSTGICQGRCRLGQRTCVAGVYGSCVGEVLPAPAELCNGIDDDCDGTIDEGVTFTCKNYTNCTSYTSCFACPSAPDELCDGKDNDCDGTIDEDALLVGSACGKEGLDACSKGKLACENGALVCKGGTGTGTEEVCNGIDDDCDGLIDDNVPGTGIPCGEETGVCEKGTIECTPNGLECVGAVTGTPEICNGKDDDCDGETDEQAECPGESICLSGSCVAACIDGEFACPSGTRCTNGYCIPDECAEAHCGTTERCIDGNCVEKCSLANCASHESCEPTTGSCFDTSCLTKGCPSGKVCVNYTCIDTPCKSDTCAEDELCVDGTCYDTCLNVSCDKGQVCVRGSCVVSPCEGYSCPTNHVCKEVNGKPSCDPDPCRFINCSGGQVCREGACKDDPCATTKCPEGFVCKLTAAQGLADCKAVNPGMTQQILATGAGGWTCSVGGSGDSGFGAFISSTMFLLFVMMRRRSRR